MASSISRNVVNGVNSGGLITTQFPAARAAPSTEPRQNRALFHGTMMPTTPYGSSTE